MAFFDRFFPVLGSQFGLGSLGIFQGLYVSFSFLLAMFIAAELGACITFLSIGAAILSHHVNKFTLVTAFFLFSMGCVNMTLGLIFRELAKSKRSIRAWRRGDDAGALPMHTGDLASPDFRPSLFGGKPAETSEKSSGLGFGKQGEKQAGLRGTGARTTSSRMI